MAQWAGKLFVVQSEQDPNRTMTLTMLADRSWRAGDPKGMVASASGTYQYAAGMTSFAANHVHLFRFDDCDPSSISAGDYGSGLIARSAETVRWRCDSVFQ